MMSNRLLTVFSGGAPTPWYLAGGAPTPVAAYQAKGAASLAASYLRIAGTGGNANLDPAVVGSGVAPSLGATGWAFSGTQWLNTGIIPSNSNVTLLVQYSENSVNTKYLCGFLKSGIAEIALMANDGSNRVVYYNTAGTGNLAVSPSLASGNLGLAGRVGFRNGTKESGTMGGSAFSSGNDAFVAIGALNLAGTGVLAGVTANIAAFAFWDVVLSDAQMQSIALAMAAL